MRMWLKILMVLGLTVAILVPLLLIRGVIHDRLRYRAEAVQTITRSEAGAQGLVGPVVIVPWTSTIEVEERNDKGEVLRTVKKDGESGRWLFFPRSMALVGTMEPYTRTLGLHEVRMYGLQARMDADFRIEIPADDNPELPRRIGKPWLSYGIADVRGLRGMPGLKVNGAAMVLQQGHGARETAGVHVRLDAPEAGSVLALETALDIDLAGAEALAISPVAEQNRIALDSSWKHPQFNGAFLPRTRSVDDTGFKAEWELSSLATNAQGQYRSGSDLTSHDAGRVQYGGAGLDAVGISLVDPINPYMQADRATKYGLLFVLLTFVGFFMFEMIKRLRIHPIQYALVGLAIAIFFLLLVAMSEHVAFARSYLAASVACISLIAFYLAAVLRSTLRGIGFAAMLSLLYACLYGLLVSEDNALVLGAGLLFVILAAIMVMTRRMDWYQLASSQGQATAPPAVPGAAVGANSVGNP